MQNDEILKRLEAIEIKLDALLYYLGEEEPEEGLGGDEYGVERDTSQTL